MDSIVITREGQMERIEALEKQKAQMVAQINAIDGALLEARSLLGRINKLRSEGGGAKDDDSTEPPLRIQQGGLGD